MCFSFYELLETQFATDATEWIQVLLPAEGNEFIWRGCHQLIPPFTGTEQRRNGRSYNPPYEQLDDNNFHATLYS